MAAPVAGPMAQMRPRIARVSKLDFRSLSRKKRTPFALVKTSQSYEGNSPIARSSGP